MSSAEGLTQCDALFLSRKCALCRVEVKAKKGSLGGLIDSKHIFPLFHTATGYSNKSS